MLKALAGIFSPDEGIIDLHNKSVSLLSIGVGFNKNLSGRENIMLSGMLLGFSEEEIKEKMPQIIEFAEIGDFIDVPVKNYSSGMKSRLAFSIATTVKSQILILDEVLSVGDAAFKVKSTKRMKEMMAGDVTLLFVSHSISQVKELCDRAIWLDHGKVLMDGEVNEVCDKYLEFVRNK